MFEVRFSKEAEDAYKKVKDAVARRINRCIETIARNPFYGPNIKKLRG